MVEPLANTESAACDGRFTEHAHALGSIEKGINSMIDRLQKANRSDYDPSQFEEARKRLWGYMAKYGRHEKPASPDDDIVAQWLACASWSELESLLYDLMAERKPPGDSPAWFVTVALQRIHGFSPGLQRAARARAKASAVPPSRAECDSNRIPPGISVIPGGYLSRDLALARDAVAEVEQIKRDLLAMAGRKRMR
jgi:hypothetical protein